MNIDIEKYLSKFKVYKSDTLFDTDDFIILLKQSRCPICGNRLVQLRDGTKYLCRGVKHKKPFLISTEKLVKIRG